MSDTQYLIDIAAQMKGGEESIGQLTALAQKLTGMSSATAALDSAMTQANAALAKTKTDATAAAEALKAGEARYAELEVAANRAAKALEAAGLKTKGSVPADLAQKAQAAAAALKAEAVALDQLRAKSEQAAAAQQKAAAAAKQLQAASAAAGKQAAAAQPTGKLNEAAEGFGQLGGAVGQVGQRVTQFGEGLKKLRGSLGGAATVILLVAAAMVILTTAIVAGTIAMAKWGIELANSRRDTALTVEALEASNDAFARLGKMMPGISRGTGQSVDQLMALAKQLQSAKVGAGEMRAALRAAALAETALGSGGAAKFIEQIKEGKLSVDEFAKTAEKKFGGIVARKMLGLEQQGTTLKKNLASVFGGLNIEPFLMAISRLVELFDTSTAMGKTLRFMFEGLFQPLINGAAKGAYFLEAFFLGMAIGALKLYITFKPAIQAVQEFFGIAPNTSLEGALNAAKIAGEIFVAVLVAGAAVVAVAFALIGVAVATVVAVVVAIGAAAAAGVAGFVAAVAAAVGAIAGFVADATAAGGGIVNGIAEGISGAADAVLSAITGVVGGAIDAAKAMLGIASPSKVFARMGGQVGEGFEGGVDDSAGGARSALESMVEPPDMREGGTRAARAAAGIVIEQLVINGMKDADSVYRAVEEAMTKVLEGDSLSLGGGEVPT